PQLTRHRAARYVAHRDPEGDRRAAAALLPPIAAVARATCEALGQQCERALRALAGELLEAPVQDRALPASAVVLVHLEADLGILAHHPHLLALDRDDVDALAVVRVDHRHDVRETARMTADPSDELAAEELVDLGAGA